MATTVLLGINGVHVELGDDEAIQIVLAVAEGNLDVGASQTV